MKDDRENYKTDHGNNKQTSAENIWLIIWCNENQSKVLFFFAFSFFLFFFLLLFFLCVCKETKTLAGQHSSNFSQRMPMITRNENISHMVVCFI